MTSSLKVSFDGRSRAIGATLEEMQRTRESMLRTIDRTHETIAYTRKALTNAHALLADTEYPVLGKLHRSSD